MERSVFGRLVMLWCAVCLLWPVAAEAAQRVVAEDFSVELPEWWMQIVPAPAGSVIAVRSRKKERSLSVSATSVEPDKVEQGKSEYLAASKKWLTEHGYVVNSEAPVEQNGVTWSTISATAGTGATNTVWIAGAEGRIYILRAEFEGGDVTKDTEVQETLRSFQRVPMVAAEPARTRIVLHGPVNFARVGTPLIVLLIVSVIAVAVLLVFQRSRQEKG